MSWITIGWILVVAFLINAIRWKWFQEEDSGVPSMVAIAFASFVLFVVGCCHWHVVAEKPIKEKYTWIPIYQEDKTYYFLYKADSKAKVSFYSSKDPKAYPKRILRTKNYYHIPSEDVDFGGAELIH